MGIDVKLTGVPQFAKLEVVRVIPAILNKPANEEYVVELIEHNLGYEPVALVFAKPYLSFSVPGSASTEFSFTTPFDYFVRVGPDVGKVAMSIYSSVTSTELVLNVYTPNLPSYSGEYGWDFDTEFICYLLRQVGR